MDSPLTNNDILSIVLCTDNITTGSDYKACTLVCRSWKNAIMASERVYMYMNVISTLIMRHPELKWKSYMGDRVTMEIIDNNLIPRIYVWITNNSRLTPKFIRDNWDELTFMEPNPALTMDLIDEFWDKLHVRKRWLNPNLTYEFIEKHISEVNWDALSDNYGLDARVIERWSRELVWSYLSKNIALTQELIYKYIELINWTFIWENPNITMKFIEKYKDKGFIYNQLARYNQNLTMEFIEKNINNFHRYALSQCKYLTPAFIRKHIAKLDMCVLSANRAFTLELVEEYIDLVDWAEISYNPNVTIAFMEKHIARFSGYLYDSATMVNVL